MKDGQLEENSWIFSGLLLSVFGCLRQQQQMKKNSHQCDASFISKLHTGTGCCYITNTVRLQREITHPGNINGLKSFLI